MSKQTFQAIGLRLGLCIMVVGVVLGPVILLSEATAQPTRPGTGTTIARDLQRIDDLERNVVCYQSYSYGGGLTCLQLK